MLLVGRHQSRRGSTTTVREGEVIAINPVDIARQWLRELDSGGF